MSPRRPLEDAGFNEVITRVAYQLIVLDYRKRPRPYAVSPFNAILDLAFALRKEAFGGLVGPVVAAAKWCSQGYSLAEWRSEYPWFSSPSRARHKVRAPRR